MMLPVLYSSQDFILYSYPLLMGLGWGVAYQVFMSLWPESSSRFHAQILFWGSFIFSWVGAKLLFLITLPQELSQLYLTDTSFWTGGGFVFYGGLIGGLVFLLIYKAFKLPLHAQNFWPIVPAITFGHAIGRIGCFLAGCCYGKPTEWWWGVFLHEAYRHPTQILESLGLLLLGFYLLKAKLSIKRKASDYLIWYGLVRFGVEILRGDAVRGEWGLLTPSQWISLAFILAGFTIRLSDFRSLSARGTKIIK